MPDDGKVAVSIPDLPGCFTFGYDTIAALLAAKDAMEIWLWSAENEKEVIPLPSDKLEVPDGGTITLTLADTDDYRRKNDNRAVKKS